MRLTFTGIRDVPNDVELMRRLHDSVEDHINRGFTRYQVGLAVGSDAWFTKSVIRHKIKYPHIKLVGYVPCQEQDKLWNTKQKEEYKYLLKNCDEVILVSDLPYAGFLMIKRNERMVNECDAVLSIYDFRGSGGTYQTIKYTNKLEKPITIIKV